MTMLTADRREVVNASEAAALFGLHPFKTGGARDLYLMKRYPTDDEKPHGRKDIGHVLEPWLLDQLEEHVGTIDRPDADFPLRFVRADLCLAATLDGRAGTRDSLDGPERPIVCEGKTAALFGPGVLDEWGDEWTDQIPNHMTIQVNVQMICCGAQEAYVVVFIGGQGVKFYRIQRSDALCEQIIERARRLMASVKAEHFEFTDWPACGPSSVTALIRREPKSTTPLAVRELTELAPLIGLASKAAELAGRYDPIEVYQILGAIKTQAELLHKTVRDWIVSELGDAELGLLDDGSSVSYKQQSRTNVDARLLAASYPEAFDACSSVSTYRVMRVHKPTKSKGSKCPKKSQPK